ncbi:MAG: hypothetical protein GY929_08425 [Actinomycetia bacterium]|nr:hypothetical protein [Actinomycetes bacterium]
MRWFTEASDIADPPTANRRVIARVTAADLGAHLRRLPGVDPEGPIVSAASVDDWLVIELDPRMGADVFHLLVHSVATTPNASWDDVIGVADRQRSKPGYFVRPIGSDADVLEGWQDDGRSIAVRVASNRVWRSEASHIDPIVRSAMMRAMGIPSGLDIMPLAELEHPTAVPFFSPALRTPVNPTNETTNTRRQDLNGELQVTQ